MTDTMHPERKRLIEKVAKLLAMAESTTHEAEAATARALASKLMAEHDLTMESLTADEEFVTEDEDTGAQVKTQFRTVLHRAIARINGVTIIFQPACPGRPKAIHKLVGKRSNITCYKYMLDLVIAQRTVAWKAYRVAHDIRNSEVQRTALEYKLYHNGFAIGVDSKVRELMAAGNAERQSSNALVPVASWKQAQDWYAADHDVRFSKPKPMGYNGEGFRAGQSVSLHRGVEKQTSVLRLK